MESSEHNKQNSAIHYDSYGKVEQESHVSVPQSKSNVIDLTCTEETSKSIVKASIKDKNMKNKLRAAPQPGIKDDLTILAHFSLAIYVLIICYLCLANPFTFFTWHPLLLTIGVSLFIFIIND